MGTNYYLHLGKRHSNGAVAGCTFTQAVDVAALGHRVEFGVAVQDEYGNEMTFEEFLGRIEEDRMRTDQIGRRFS